MYKQAAFAGILKGIGRAFSKLGDEGLDLLKYVWRGADTPSAKRVFKHEVIENIPEEVSKLELVNRKAQSELMEGFNKARQRLRQDITSLSTDHRAAIGELGRLQRLKKTRQSELRRLEQAVEQGYMEHGSSLAKLEGELADIDNGIKYFSDIADKSSESIKELRLLNQAAHNTPKEFLSTIQRNPEMSARFTSLDDMAHAIESQLRRKYEISKAISPNLGKPQRFMQEYVNKIKPLPDDDELKAVWLLNPANKTMLMDLQRNPRSKKYMAKLLSKQTDKITPTMAKSMKDLKGKSKSSIAKKLGISLGAASALAAVLGLYSWFDDTKQIQKEVSGSLDDLNSFKTVGMGQVIVDNVRSTLKALEIARNTAASKMDTKQAKEGITHYVEALARAKDALDKALGRWSIVIQNADNPDTAKSAQLELSAFRDKLATELKKLETEVPSQPTAPGMTGTVQPAKHPSRQIPTGRIIDVQAYLSKDNPYVGETGMLDRETVRSLKSLEQEYNELGDTDRFTGLFVDLDKNHLISATDLQKIEQTMEKYR